MMAPISARATIERRCPRWSGVSRIISISLRLSLSVTSAARMRRFDEMPWAIEDIVFTEHGAITIASVRKEPLAKRAPMSSKE